MFRLVVLLSIVHYVYGQNCLVAPDPVTGHVSAADLSAALNATSTPTVIGTALTQYSIYSKAGFYECTALKSIEIPASVTVIGKFAFGYSGLESVSYLGNKPNDISYWAFTSSPYGNCRLDETTPGMNITTGHGTYGGLSTDSFKNCKYLTSVTIPDGVNKIHEFAFKSTALTSVTIPSSVTEIGMYAFRDSGLTSVDFSNATSLKTIGQTAFMTSTLTSVDLNGATGVTTVDGAVFWGLTDTIFCMTQPDSGHVSAEALSDALGGTTTIGDSASSYSEYRFRGFHGCTALKSVKIPASVTMIGYEAFAESGVTSVDFSGAIALTSIGNGAFYRADLTSVTIPNSVESIVSRAFTSCHLTSVIIPESVDTIGSTSQYAHGAFAHNSITELAILGTPTFYEHVTTYYSSYYSTFSRGSGGPLQLKRYCFNHSALPEFIQNQLDIVHAVHDCTFWCETGTGQISTNYNCTKPWSTSCDAGFYFAPKPTGMQVSMSDTCKPCPSGKFQPNNNSVATSCTPWTTENGKRLVTAGTAVADAVWEDALSPSAMNATWSSLTCVGGQTYTATIGPCVVGKICFDGGTVLECTGGTVQVNETHCSSEKEVVYDALKSHCPL